MTSGCPRRHCWTTWTRRTDGKYAACWFWVFHACAAGFVAAEDSRHPPVFVFTSGCCGGPEWAEKTVSKSKPIRTHFCCIPSPTPPTPRVTSPRTDDVTDCCEHCFHGNAHHRFGLHFRQLSLPPFSTPPPLLLYPSLSLPPPCRPASSPLA